MKRALVLLAVGLVFVSGCKPTYPQGSAEQAIVAICQKEYGVKVRVKSVGRTLGAQVVARNLLSQDLTFTDAAMSKIENVMLTTTRVTLSSEFRYDFFVISILDPATRVQVSFVRYIKDIRRLVMDDISRNEYFQRMLIDATVQPAPPAGVEEDYQLREYTLPDFLARQMGDRLRLQFQSGLVVDRLFQLTAVLGSYQPGRRSGRGQFRMALHFAPNAPAYESVATPRLHQDFLKLVSQTAGPIVRRYDFADYEGMELVDGATGRQLAFLQREQFDRETPLTTLMELIKSIKKK